MSHKKLVSMGLVIVLTLCLTGISFAGTLSEIVKRGELRVAVQSGAAPYAFVDKNGVHTGSMIDFAQGMADAMGVKLTVLDFDWDGLIPALLSGKADILAADMTPTLKRALKISFVDPWMYVQTCVFTKTLAVGTLVTQSPPHRPGRAVFPHPVPRLYSLSRKTISMQTLDVVG